MVFRLEFDTLGEPLHLSQYCASEKENEYIFEEKEKKNSLVSVH